jgi:hypothetical protein
MWILPILSHEILVTNIIIIIIIIIITINL